MPYIIELLLKLFCIHFIADIPLQSEEMAKQKNPHALPPKAYDPKVHGPLLKCWPYYMASHACIHAVGVYYVTDCFYLALAEFCLHYFIDSVKSYWKLSIHLDQFLHLLCKVIYVIIFAYPYVY